MALSPVHMPVDISHSTPYSGYQNSEIYSVTSNQPLEYISQTAHWETFNDTNFPFNDPPSWANIDPSPQYPPRIGGGNCLPVKTQSDTFGSMEYAIGEEYLLYDCMESQVNATPSTYSLSHSAAISPYEGYGSSLSSYSYESDKTPQKVYSDLPRLVTLDCSTEAPAQLDQQKSMETDCDRLLQRLSFLCNAHTQVSSWSVELNKFYTTERNKLTAEHIRDKQCVMAASGFGYLLPLLDNYYNKHHLILTQRVSQSVTMLENYHLNDVSLITSVNPVQCRMNNKPKRISRRRPPKHLKPEAHAILMSWYRDHKDNPYPDMRVCRQLAEKAEVSLPQVKKWFCNKRARTNNTRSLAEIVKLRKASRRLRT